jgi:hypothetical protein
VPAGTHPAVLTLMAELGVQNDSKYKPREELYFRWEIPDLTVSWRDSNGKERTGPAVIGKHYTKSLAPKSTLRADLESWRGRAFTDEELRDFDLTKFLGQPCQLGIVHQAVGDRTYANVAVVMGAPKGAAPKPSGKLIAFDVDSWDEEAFAALPDWLQKRINERVVTSAAPEQPSNGSSGSGGADETPFDVPF